MGELVKQLQTGATCMVCTGNMPMETMAMFIIDPVVRARLGRTVLDAYVGGSTDLAWCSCSVFSLDYRSLCSRQAVAVHMLTHAGLAGRQ